MTERYNLLPEDYRGHLEEARTHGRDLWENNGWGIRSTRGSGDTLIWTSPYLLRSRPGAGPFVAEASSVLQSMLISVDYPAAEKDRMHDNPFLAAGWNGTEELHPAEAVAIETKHGATTWRLAEMEYRAAPPDWSIHGSHGRLRFAFDLHADAPAIWMTDRSLSALEAGDRWIMLYADAHGQLGAPDGSIEVDGRVWHERHIHLTTDYDPTVLLHGSGLFVHNAFSPELDLFLLVRPELGRARARIITRNRGTGGGAFGTGGASGNGAPPSGGAVFEFEGIEEVAHHVVDTWIDPRSGFSIPCRWRIELRNARATARFTISGFARSYYLWNNLRRGVNVLYWWLAESTGVVEPAGEQPLRVSGAKHVVHQNRAFYHYS